MSDDGPLYGFSRASGRGYRIDAWAERDDGTWVALETTVIDASDVPDGWVAVYDTGDVPEITFNEDSQRW